MERNYVYEIVDSNDNSMINGKRRLYSTLGHATGALKQMENKGLLILRFKFESFVYD